MLGTFPTLIPHICIFFYILGVIMYFLRIDMLVIFDNSVIGVILPSDELSDHI